MPARRAISARPRAAVGSIGAAAFGAVMTSRFSSGLGERLTADITAGLPPGMQATLMNPQAMMNPQVAAQIRDTGRRVVENPLIERDGHLPDFAELRLEAEHARRLHAELSREQLELLIEDDIRKGLDAIEIALRDARAMRALTSSDWYRARWPGVEFPRDDSASTATALFANTRGGFRKSDTIRGQWTGEHGDDVIVDDPLDPQGAAGSTELDAVLEWWCGTMPTRFRSHATSTRTLIMQRLHEADLTREFIRAGATVLCLPMRFERAHPHRWARDPRTAEGELLCPVRIDEAATKRMEDILGPARAAAQLQQRPSPAGGAVFKAEWFRWWTELPAGGVWSIDVDATFKATDDGSYVVIQVWCDDGARHYLVDQIRRRMGFADTVAAIRAARAQWPKVRTVRIEDKANGPAIIEALRDEMTGVVAVSPEGGKEARANAVQGIVAGGGVYLPDEQHAKYDDGRRGAPWVASFIHEAVTFPKGESDDQVDAMTQHLNASAGSFAARLKSAFGKGAEKK